MIRARAPMNPFGTARVRLWVPITFGKGLAGRLKGAVTVE